MMILILDRQQIIIISQIFYNSCNILIAILSNNGLNHRSVMRIKSDFFIAHVVDTLVVPSSWTS